MQDATHFILSILGAKANISSFFFVLFPFLFTSPVPSTLSFFLTLSFHLPSRTGHQASCMHALFLPSYFEVSVQESTRTDLELTLYHGLSLSWWSFCPTSFPGRTSHLSILTLPWESLLYKLVLGEMTDLFSDAECLREYEVSSIAAWFPSYSDTIGCRQVQGVVENTRAISWFLSCSLQILVFKSATKVTKESWWYSVNIILLSLSWIILRSAWTQEEISMCWFLDHHLNIFLYHWPALKWVVCSKIHGVLT